MFFSLNNMVTMAQDCSSFVGNFKVSNCVGGMLGDPLLPGFLGFDGLEISFDKTNKKLTFSYKLFGEIDRQENYLADGKVHLVKGEFSHTYTTMCGNSLVTDRLFSPQGQSVLDLFQRTDSGLSYTMLAENLAHISKCKLTPIKNP